MQYNRKSPFVKFGKAYCDKFGKFQVDATGNRVYDEVDFWEAFLIKREYDNRNRGNQ
jgi:hypothetical protein